MCINKLIQDSIFKYFFLDTASLFCYNKATAIYTEAWMRWMKQELLPIFIGTRMWPATNPRNCASNLRLSGSEIYGGVDEWLKSTVY